MKPGLVCGLLLFLCSPLKAEIDPASVFAGLGASLGRGRVTARLTYDRRKAAGGGLIYAAARTSLEDVEAIRLSEGVLTTSGGLLSHAAMTAREHGVAALILSQGRWEEGALVLSAPVFGPSRGVAGEEFRVVEKTAPRRVAEGEVVTLDPARGLLILYPPSEQDFELDLAEALRAYEGLKDSRALAHWAEERSEEGGAAALRAGSRLLEELSDRLAQGSARAEDLAAVKEALESRLSPEAKSELKARERKLFSRELRLTLKVLADYRSAVDESGTVQAAGRLESELKGRWERVSALARFLGAQVELKNSAGAYATLARLCESRKLALGERKAESLAEAVKAAGASTPESVKLPGELYRRFLAEFGLSPMIEEIASDASLDLRRKSERIRALITAAKLEGTPLGRDILARFPAQGFFAAQGAPEAGYVPAGKALSAVQESWAALWSPEALGARKRQGGPLEPEGSIALERFTPAEASGVVFSRDPVSGSLDRLIVSAVLGDRAGLSQGLASDQYVLERRSGREVFRALVADKREKLEFDPQKRELRRVMVPPGPSLSRCLSAEQLETVAKAARALDNHFGYGIEAYFAAAGGKLYILETRPIGRLLLAGGAAPAESPFSLSPASPDVPAVKPVR